jgi:hypothetical protein
MVRQNLRGVKIGRRSPHHGGQFCTPKHNRKSRAETKLHSVKPLDQRLMVSDFERKVIQFQVRAAVLNCFTALGMPVTEAVVRVCPGKGEPRPLSHLCMYGCPRWCK